MNYQLNDYLSGMEKQVIKIGEVKKGTTFTYGYQPQTVAKIGELDIYFVNEKGVKGSLSKGQFELNYYGFIENIKY